MSFQSLAHSGLGRALAWSLTAHLLLLWPSPPARRVFEQPEPLLVTLPTPASAIITKLPVKPPNPDPIAARHVSAAAISDVPVVTSGSTSTDGARSDNRPLPVALVDGDAESLRGFRLALARAAVRFKRYPQQAIDAGWSGTVSVRVTMSAEGPLQQTLLESSGFAALDDSAVEMLRQALPATPVPASLRGKSFAVTMPIVFELPD
jgi:TonB family protein